ncbi:MAG: hypothetical protein PWQ41_13 [Bacillota bacterium]|jgi:uncharacterized phosphosugar-binding protein|nr:hypothetical protein [Bacillota bacterium]MDK2854926.1 hypothetical protein [Bacillota bacterium]MDK2924239.1 hypothetical protein [Bacillota bacterium]
MKGKEYLEKVEEILKKVKETQLKAIGQAAELVADTIAGGGLLHVFGCGHSQMYAEELFYRAGGLVPVNAILEPALSLRPEAPKSTWFERCPEYGKEIMRNEPVRPGDTLIIASTSGRNAVPIDAALQAKEMGLKVIALTSMAFTRSVKSRHASGKLLYELADVVLDNCGIEGDAVVEFDGLPFKAGPTSTVSGCAILQAVVVEAIEKLLARGITPPVWVSSNLDQGDQINARYIKEYRGRVKCL